MTTQSQQKRYNPEDDEAWEGSHFQPHWGDSLISSGEDERIGETWLSAPTPGSIEKERGGTLDKMFGILLVGERASGTTIYAFRKRIFGEIDWIEQKEEGERFKEISPSQALGFSTPETKFLSVRGVAAFTADVLLDPLTYVGVGLIGKTGKVLKIANKTDSTPITVGKEGIEFLKKEIQAGASREVAEKKLIDAIGGGKTEYLAAKKYTESSLHIFGQKILYTEPYKKAAKKVWGVLPYAQKRARGVDVLKTAFIPFHKATQEVGEAVKKPFLTFYRQTTYQTSKARTTIKAISKKTPKELDEDVVNLLQKTHPSELTKANDELVSKEMETAWEKADAILQDAEDVITAKKEATETAEDILETTEIRTRAQEEANEILLNAQPPKPINIVSKTTSTEARSATNYIHGLYDEIFTEKLKHGLAKPESYKENYMHHTPGKEGNAWIKKTYKNKELPPGEGPLQHRKIEGDISTANKIMEEKTGIQHFFIEDPFTVLKIYAAKHNLQVNAHILKQQTAKEPKTSSDSLQDAVDELKDPFQLFKWQTRYQKKKLVADISKVEKATPKKDYQDIVTLLEVPGTKYKIKTAPSPTDIVSVSDPMDDALLKADAILEDMEEVIATKKEARKKATEETAIAEIRAQAQKNADAVLLKAMREENQIPIKTTTKTTSELAATHLREIYDTAFKEKLALGIVKPEDYTENFVYLAQTKEATKWLKKTHDGTDIPPGMDQTFDPTEMEGGIFEVNKMMKEKFNIKQFYVENPYVAGQMYMAKHSHQVQSHLLHQKILKDYGRDTGTAIGSAPKIAKIEGKEYTLFKHNRKETYLPTAVHNELIRTHPRHSWWTDTYDPTLGALKKSWIAMWPGYYARNLYGGVGWQNLLAGVEPKDYARNIDILYGNPNKIYDIPLYGKKTGKELKELMESHNVLGQTGYVGEPSTIGPLSPLGQIYQKYPETAMKLSENQLRGPVFLHYLRTTGDPDHAAEMGYKFHFEYLRGTYTAFEQDVLGRGIPFWMWQRGNIPLQMEMMFRKPGIFAAQAKLYDMGSTPEEFNEMPDWQKEKLTYTHEGNVYSYDMPMMDLRSMLDPAAMYSTTTPFLQYGVSGIRGKTQYGKDMEPLNTREGAKQHGELIATTFQGRLYHAGKEVIKTTEEERPLSATTIHQLGGIGAYETPPPPKPISMEVFKAERWRESSAYAAWLAAGGTEEAPEDTGEPIKISSSRRRAEAKVIRIVDADTIEVVLNGRIQTVRYLGIDAPETKHPDKPIGLGGFEATAANKRLVEGQTVYLEKDKTHEDKYDRLLRNVFLEDDTFVNAELVRLGYAKESYYRPNKRYKELLEELEAEAPEIKAVHPWGGYASLEEQEHAVWVAAGSPEDFHIKTLPDGTKLALTHDAYETSKRLKLTEGQEQYVYNVTEGEPPGSRETRYNELVAEWQAFKSGKLEIEQPTEEQRMASWRRAKLAPEKKYKQKAYRDDLGKLLGIITYTPKELEELKGFTPSKAQKKWAFRDTIDRMPSKEQFEIYATESEKAKEEQWDEKVQKQKMLKEYRELDPYAPIQVLKGDGHVLSSQFTDVITDRFKHKEELADLLGIGVDR